MTHAIALQQRTDVPTSVTEMMQIAKFMAASKMLPNHLAGDEASVFSVMTAARSLDIPMWAAFQQIIVQKGRTSMSATLMQALVLRGGYNLYAIEDRCDDTGAHIYVERPGIGKDQCGHTIVSFTVDDALRAKLVTRNEKTGKLMARSVKGEALPWESYTADMFIWRAISRACRRYFPDVMMGMLYTPEEVGALVDEDGQPIASGAVTVDVPPEVSALALKIAACESRRELRVIFSEVSSKSLGDALVDGVSLMKRLELRLKDLPNDVQEPEGAAAAAAPVEAEVVEATEEAPVEAVVEESAPVEAEATEEAPAAEAPTEEPAAEVEPSENVAEESAGGDDEWAALEAEADAGTPVVVPDPEESRKASPRREAIENTLVSLFEGVDAMEAAAVEEFGLGTDDVSTERLQSWAVTVRKGAGA